MTRAPRGPWSSRSASRPRSATAAARRPGRRRSSRPASSSSSTTRSSAASPISTTAWRRCAQPAIAGPIEAALDQLAGIVETVLAQGKFPFVLGGEHSLTAGAIRPFAARHPDLVVLQFDAHADLRDGYQGERYSHAAAMRRVLDHPGRVARLGRHPRHLAGRGRRSTTPTATASPSTGPRTRRAGTSTRSSRRSRAGRST